MQMRVGANILRLCRTIAIVSAFFCGLSGYATGYDQTTREIPPQATQRINKLISELPADSSLHTRLVHGGRGNGIHLLWMDNMRRENVRQAVIWIGIEFNSHGRPKQMKVAKIRYYTQYDDERSVVNANQLASIRASGLESELTRLALERSKRAGWMDVPHPRPNPFVGAARIEFFDDEWFPIFEYPMYCADDFCLGDKADDK